jgi:hypothetical protein
LAESGESVLVMGALLELDAALIDQRTELFGKLANVYADIDLLEGRSV